MRKQIADTIEHMKLTFERGYKALVDFIPFNDGMAKFIGCEPNYVKYFSTDFKMWLPMVYAPIQPCQYRLVGPGANPKLARETIIKTPYYKWPKERIARDFNTFVLNFIGGFAGILGIGGMEMRVQGQLRPVFEMFAMAYMTTMMASYYFGHNYVAGGMLFFLLMLGKIGSKAMSRDVLLEGGELALMKASHSNFSYSSSEDVKQVDEKVL